MQASLEKSFQYTEFQCKVNGVVSTTSAVYAAFITAGIECGYTDTAGTTTKSLEIEVKLDKAPTTGALTTQYTVKFMGATVHTSTDPGWNTGATLNFRIYNAPYSREDQKWDERWASWEVRKNGSVVTSGGSGSQIGLVWTPAGEPLFGLGVRAGGNAAINPMPVAGDISSGMTTASQSVSGSYECGWRFYNGSEFETYNVTPLVESISTSCTCLPSLKSPSVSSTWAATGEFAATISQVKGSETVVECDECTNGPATSPFVFKFWDTSLAIDRYASAVWLIPDLPKECVRLNSDYLELVKRFSPCGTRISRITGCSTDPTADVEYLDTSREVHPKLSIFLEEVGISHSGLEVPFGWKTYAPATAYRENWSRTKRFWEIVTPGACPLADEEHPDGGEVIRCFSDLDSYCYGYRGSNFPVIDAPTGQCDPNLNHPDAIAAYMNQVAAPHWLCMDHYPLDRGDEQPNIQPDEWPVDGARANPWEYKIGEGYLPYWGPLGDQYMANPSLPGGGTKVRNSIVAGSLGEGPHAHWFFSRVGHKSSPWGLRFFAQNVELPDSFLYDSSSTAAWTFKNSSGTSLTSSFAAGGITVTPAGGDTAVICDLDLGVWSEKPYMLAHWAKGYTIDWSTTNVAAVSVQLIGADGSTLDISTTRNTRADWPAIISGSNYAGSWGMDRSPSADITDQGSDVAAGGSSTATMAGVESSYAFQLLPGRTAQKLRITITASSAASTVQLKYPTLHFKAVSGDYYAKVHRETRQMCNVTHSYGPGLRWGNWNFWDYTTDQFNPDLLSGAPAWLGVASQCTALDGLCFKRLALQGKSASDGLDTEINSLWDSYERGGAGGSRQNAAYYTCAWVMEYAARAKTRGRTGLTLCIANLCQASPHPMLPRRKLDIELQETGDFGLWTYALSFKNRDVVVSQSVGTELIDPSGPTTWTSAATSPPGWAVTTHAHTLTNSETDFEIKRLGTLIADEIRPWHGEFWVNGSSVSSSWVDNDTGWDGSYNEVTLAGGNVQFSRWDSGVIPGAATVTSTVTAGGGYSQPSVLAMPDGTLKIMYVKSSGVYRRISYDNGKTWNAEVLVMADRRYPRSIVDQFGVEVEAWFKYNSGTSGAGRIEVKTRSSGAPSWSSTATIATDVYDTAFGLTDAENGGNALRIAAISSDGSTQLRFESYDSGATWASV